MTDTALRINKRVRQSTLGAFDICLRRGQYELTTSVPRTNSEASVVGTAYHAGLEAYYTIRKENGFYQPTEGPLMKAILDVAHEAYVREAMLIPDTGWDTDWNRAWDKVVDMLDHYFRAKRYWPEEYLVIGVEHQFTIPWINGWDAHGTIDLVLLGPDGPEDHILVDHKTAGKRWPQGKESPRKNNQPPFYCWAWGQLTGVPPRFVFDVMSYNLTFERREATPTSNQIELVLSKAKQVTALLDSGLELPANPGSMLCSEKWCRFWDHCPHGAAAK